jgi:hypothetical protein
LVAVEKDLSAWREFRQISTESNGTIVHAYLVWDEATRDAALFDTGWDAAPAFKLIEENQLQLKHLFITPCPPIISRVWKAMRAKFPKALLHTDAKSARHNIRIAEGLHSTGQPAHHEPRHPRPRGRRCDLCHGTWPDDAPHVAIVGDAIFAGHGSAPQHGALAKKCASNPFAAGRHIDLPRPRAC